MDSMEYKLGDPEPEFETIEQKSSKKIKIIISILISIIILLLVGLIVILILYLKKKDNKDNKDNEDNEDNIDIKDYQKIIEFEKDGVVVFYNFSYPSGNTIKNSFREGQTNYNSTIGNINNGLDYHKTESNKYDLYIPQSVLKRKDKYNKIMLNIHGGAWMGGQKTYYDEECKERTKLGYICATMEYNFLKLNDSPDFTIFRMLDEITAVQESIKLNLKQLGFNETKLELCIGGGSAGAHLSLLYSYWLGEKSPIPIKFVLNAVAPVTLEFEHWLFYREDIGPLDNIEPEDIENANRFHLIQNNSNFYYNNTYLTLTMNLFLGRAINHNINYMIIDAGNWDINQTNKYFTELLNSVKVLFPVNHINEKTLPTLCYYGGKDIDVGIAQFAYLRNKFNEYNNTNLELIYSKYAVHNVTDTETEEGKKANAKLDEKFKEYTNKYFSKD